MGLPSCRPSLRRALPGALIFILTLPLPAQPPSPTPPTDLGHRDVSEVRLLVPGGGRVDWSAQGDRIAFDRAGGDGLYDVFLMRPDGTDETCLTCEPLEFRKVNAMNPAWHPSGEYLVFQVQGAARKMDLSAAELAEPLRAVRSELWAIRRDGRSFWQLTRLGERGGAATDPHFSHEADRLLWSERVSNRREPWGEWVVRVAELKSSRGILRLGGVKTFRPAGDGFLLAHGFAPNDRGFLFSAAPGLAGGTAAAAGVDGLDLYLFELDGGAIRPLTDSPTERDDAARFVPGSDLVAWASDKSSFPGRRLPRRQDLWLRSLDGSRQERLTFFNHPGSDAFLGEALIDDVAWSPQGDRFLLHVVSASPELQEAIYLVVLTAGYRR